MSTLCGNQPEPLGWTEYFKEYASAIASSWIQRLLILDDSSQCGHQRLYQSICSGADIIEHLQQERFGKTVDCLLREERVLQDL